MYIGQVKRQSKDGVSSELLNMAVHLLTSYSSKARAPHFWQVLGILPATWSETKSIRCRILTILKCNKVSGHPSFIGLSSLSNNISSMKMYYRNIEGFGCGRTLHGGWPGRATDYDDGEDKRRQNVYAITNA